MKLHTTTSISSSSRRPFRARTRFMVAAVSGCFAAGVLANPVGPSVVAGTASIAQIGKTMTVTNSAGAILNWNQFNIAAGETTRFIQPTASSAVLNRVLGADPSQIYGTLSSNGKVWLINPAGILVGASGRIDTAGFVASTLGVSNSDFLAGRLNFGSSEGGTSGIGAVVNQGAITTSAGGSVYLVAPNVVNQGIITTPQGETILAAGQTVHLVDTGTPGVKVEITGAEGNATNLGDIVADAGRIGIAGVMVRNSGTLNASSVVSDGGRIFLKASQDAYVDGAGRIVTTGTKGGSVEVLGNRVAVTDTASIDASGTGDGGSIKVGGDYQGKNPDLQNATVTYFGPDASLKADAGSVGAGGTVIVWADDTTRAYGSISARGGATGGDGGFVETSGKAYLAVDGIRVDTRGPQGKAGTWLLDPSDITITYGGATTAAGTFVPSNPPGIPTVEFTTSSGNTSTISDTTITTQLVTTDVVIHTAGGTGGSGNITVTGANIFADSNGWALTLAADGSGSGTGNITITNSTINVDDGVTMLAGWTGVMPPYGADGNTLSKADVIPGTGIINISGSTITSPGVSGGGFVALWAGKDINLTSNTAVQAVSVNLDAGNDITSLGSRIGGLNSSVVGIDLKAGRDVTITTSAFETYGGAMSIDAGRNFTLTATTGNGAILSTAGCSTPSSVDCRTGPYTAGGLQTITAAGTVKVEANANGGFGVALFSGGGQTITADRVEVLGGVSGPNNDAYITNRSSDNQEITAHTIVLKAGGTANTDENNDAVIYSSAGAQSITVTGSVGTLGSLSIYGGAAGHGNTAGIYSTSGAQNLDVHGSILVQGGGDAVSYLNYAGIENSTNQTINIYDGGSVVLRGGAGGGVAGAKSTSDNYATIKTTSGDQTIDFQGTGGSLDLYGGSVGNSNVARIWNSGAGQQTITGNPVITMTGGDTGGAGAYGGDSSTDPFYSGSFAPVRGNNAMIAAGQAFDSNADALVDTGTWIKGTQAIDASSITINGSSRDVISSGLAGAGFFSAYGQTINVVGALKLLGGNATGGQARSRTRLWSMGGEQEITANQLHVIGAASGTNNIETVGSWGNQTITLSADDADGPALWLQTNGSGSTNVLNNSLDGTQTVTFTGEQAILRVEGSFASLATNSNNANTAHPDQYVEFVNGGSIEVLGVGRPIQALDNFQIPRASIGSSGNQEITGATSITLTGSNSSNGRALIFAHGNQHIETNTLSLTGGGGNAFDSYVGIMHGDLGDQGLSGGLGDQTIVLTGANASITLRGGSGNGFNANEQESGNFAAIGSAAGNQTVHFDQTGGKISIYGGSVGSGNKAGIGSDYGQTITGNPVVLLRGGSSGGAASTSSPYGGDDHGNEAGIFGGDTDALSNSQSTLNFASLTINGGTADFGQAGVGGDVVSLNVQGDVTLTGGSSNLLNPNSDVPNASTAAYIAHGDYGSINMQVGGNLILTGGTGTSAPAVIGSVGGADVTVNVAGNTTLQNQSSEAYIGMLPGSTGSGTEIVNLNTSVFSLVSPGNINWGYTNVSGSSINLTAGGTITQSTPISAAALSTASYGGTTLTQNNVVGTFSGSNNGSGNISFTDARVGGLSTGVNGVTNNAVSGDIALKSTGSGSLILAGPVVSKGNVSLDSAGTISQTAAISGASLNTSSYGGSTLTQNNVVGTYSGNNSGSGNIDFKSASATGLVVATTSNSAAAGDVSLTSTGAMTVSGNLISARNIILSSVGAITATGNLSGLGLTATSVGGAAFSGANQIKTITALNNSGSGDVTLNNSANPLTIVQASNTGGNVEVDNTGAIVVSGPINASGLVGLAAFGAQGDITQSGGTITSGTDVILLADRNVSLNGQITATGEVDALSGVNSVGTAGGNISLGATSNVTAGDIVLIANRDTGTGTFTTGNVSQQAGSTLQTGNDFLINASGNIDMLGTVVGNAAGRTNLLAGFNNTTGTEQAFTGAHVTANNLQANGGSVSIQATAGINAVVQSAGVVGANINNSAAGGLNLTSYGASALVLVDNSVSASAVNLTYKNAPLTLGANSALVTGNGAGKVNVTASGGNLVYSGANVSANGVSFTSTGTISQTAPVTTSVLYTSSAGGTTLTADNVVGTYSGVNTSSGNLAFKSVKTGGLVLAGPAATAVQNLAATGDINITSAGAGALSVNGAVSSLRNVSFSSAGAINAASKLTGTGLNSVSVGGASYTGPNQIATVVNMSNTGSGNVVFNNTAAPLTIEAMSNSAGNVTVDNTGAVVINGPMTASGALSVTAHSPITVTSTGSVKAGGDLDLIASSTSFRSTIDLLTIGGEVLSDNGNIGLFGGSGIAVTAKVTATNGNVVAESPFGDITETPAGLITAPKGTVTLNANSEGPKPEDIVVVPPAEAQTINTIDAIVEVQVVAVLPTSSGSGSSRTLGDETTGGTPGTFGGGEEKKEEEKKDSNGASTSADDKPAAQRSVGACT